MLEGKLGFFIDQAASHDEVAGNPLRALGLQRLDLVLGGAVKFLARDILIDLRGPFAVRTVGAAKIARIGNTDLTVLAPVPAELAGTGVAAVETPRRTLLTVAKRLAIVTAGESATFAVAFAARTIAKGLAVAVTVRLVVTVTVRLALTATAEGLPLSAAEPSTIPLAFAARTVTKGLAVTVTVRLVVTVTVRLALTATTEGLPLSAAEPSTIPLAFAARTITKGLAVTVTERFALSPASTEAPTITIALPARAIAIRLVIAVTVGFPLTAPAEWLAFPAAEPAAVPLAFAARTITERLVVTLTVGLALSEGLAVTRAGRALRCLRIPVFTGTESARLSAGIVRAAERPAVIAAAISAVVLSHGDSSCCEPTTGAIAAARSVFRYPTQPEIKRFEVRTSQSILGEMASAHDMDRPGSAGRGNVHTFSDSALSVSPGFRGTPLGGSPGRSPVFV
ncbi:MAG: hypothetical protein NVS3B6_13310 [Pseudarthrobacter sp.]